MKARIRVGMALHHIGLRIAGITSVGTASFPGLLEDASLVRVRFTDNCGTCSTVLRVGDLAFYLDGHLYCTNHEPRAGGNAGQEGGDADSSA